MKPTVTWILIADGARARVLENTGPGRGLNEVPGLEVTGENLRAGEIMADRPGRAFASAGHGRSAMEPSTDPVEKQEADFAKSLADMLDEKLAKKAFDRLIIAAAPKALGVLRKAISSQVQATIMTEKAKDLTRIPNADLVQHFEDVLAV